MHRAVLVLPVEPLAPPATWSPPCCSIGPGGPDVPAGRRADRGVCRAHRDLGARPAGRRRDPGGAADGAAARAAPGARSLAGSRYPARVLGALLGTFAPLLLGLLWGFRTWCRSRG